MKDADERSPILKLHAKEKIAYYLGNKKLLELICPWDPARSKSFQHFSFPILCDLSTQEAAGLAWSLIAGIRTILSGEACPADRDLDNAQQFLRELGETGSLQSKAFGSTNTDDSPSWIRA